MINAFDGKVAIIQMKKHTKGYLIAIEGIDGSGKTTLTKIIQERLVNEGKDVFALPSGGFDSKEVEAQLRKIVITENSGVTKNTETLIYFASLAQKVEQYILPALYADKIVIVDRFILSTFVFAHYMFKQDRKLMEGILQFASQSIIPDFTFLILKVQNIICQSYFKSFWTKCFAKVGNYRYSTYCNGTFGCIMLWSTGNIYSGCT